MYCVARAASASLCSHVLNTLLLQLCATRHHRTYVTCRHVRHPCALLPLLLLRVAVSQLGTCNVAGITGCCNQPTKPPLRVLNPAPQPANLCHYCHAA